MRPARIIGDRSGGERVKREKRRRTERRLSAAIGPVRGKRAGPLCRSPSDSAVSRPESPLPGGEKARLGRGGWTACKTRDGSAGHAGGNVEGRQELSRKLTDRPACTWRGGNERGQGPWRCERFSAARERCWSGRCGQRGKSTRYEWLGKAEGDAAECRRRVDFVRSRRAPPRSSRILCRGFHFVPRRPRRGRLRVHPVQPRVQGGWPHPWMGRGVRFLFPPVAKGTGFLGASGGTHGFQPGFGNSAEGPNPLKARPPAWAGSTPCRRRRTASAADLGGGFA